MHLRHSIERVIWIKAVIIIVIFTLPLLAVSLPQVILPGTRTVDVTSQQTMSYAETAYAALLQANNWTAWQMTPGESNTSLNSSSNGLIFSGHFPASSSPLALSMTRPLNVNLTTYQIMYLLVKVSIGVSYGIRFSSQSGDTVIPLWTETDSLNHRAGTGRLETIQSNLVQLAELNTGRIFNTLNSVSVYVERSATPQETSFSLQLSSFEFLDYPFVSISSNRSYHSIYIGLSSVQNNPGLTLTTVQVKGRLNATTGSVLAPFLVRGLSVYPGQTQTITKSPAEVTYTIPMSTPSAALFSDSLPVGPEALVLVAASGLLGQFAVETISMTLYSRTAQTISGSNQNQPTSGYIDYAFFFLLLPTAVLILLLHQRRIIKAKKPTPLLTADSSEGARS